MVDYRCYPLTLAEALNATGRDVPSIRSFEVHCIVSTINFRLLQEITYLDEKNRKRFSEGEGSVAIRVDRIPFWNIGNFVEGGHNGEFYFKTEKFWEENGTMIERIYGRIGWKVSIEEGNTYPYLNFFIDPDFTEPMEIPDIIERFGLMDIE